MDAQTERDGSTEDSGRLSYKFQRLRERIRGAIEAGELTGRLPGERQLAQRFRANAKTISKALSDLATEGLLIRHVGRGTFVAPESGRPTAGRKMRRVGWVVAGDWRGATTTVLFESAKRIAGRHEQEVIAHTVPVDADGTLPERAIPLSVLRELDGLLLFAAKPSRGFLADLLRRHVPFVMINDRNDQVRTNCVVPDWAGGAFALCEHLIQLGHRDIRLLADVAATPTLGQAERGYVAALKRYGLAVPRPAVVSSPDALLAGSTFLTALIAAGGTMVRSAHEMLQRRGRRTPADVSFAALPDPGDDASRQLRVTAYEVDAERVVEWAFELLWRSAPGQWPQMIVVPGALVDRGTCDAGARAGGSAHPTEAVV